MRFSGSVATLLSPAVTETTHTVRLQDGWRQREKCNCAIILFVEMLVHIKTAIPSLHTDNQKRIWGSCNHFTAATINGQKSARSAAFTNIPMVQR